jgi:hypothetical protein
LPPVVKNWSCDTHPESVRGMWEMLLLWASLQEGNPTESRSEKIKEGKKSTHQTHNCLMLPWSSRDMPARDVIWLLDRSLCEVRLVRSDMATKAAAPKKGLQNIQTTEVCKGANGDGWDDVAGQVPVSNEEVSDTASAAVHHLENLHTLTGKKERWGLWKCGRRWR